MRLANLAILVLLGVPSLVLADGKADKAAAKKHIDLAKRHYNVAKYDEAIAEFKEAYTLDPDPADLFNIAQAYRLKKDCENAALFYANYQREETNKKLRDSVTKVRADMEACAKEAKPDPKPEPVQPPPTAIVEPGPVPGPPPGTAPPIAPPIAPPAPLPESADPDPNRIRRLTGKVMMGGGGVLVAIGLLELAHANTLDDKLVDHGCTEDSPFDPEDDCGSLDNQRTSAGNAAAGSLLLGGASVVIGFVLWRVSGKPDRPAVTVIPHRNGAVLSWSF